MRIPPEAAKKKSRVLALDLLIKWDYSSRVSGACRSMGVPVVWRVWWLHVSTCDLIGVLVREGAGQGVQYGDIKIGLGH